MIRAPMSAAANQINRLFVEGTVSGLSDGLLLERFVDGRDEDAFAALVERHGPMVLATCRAVVRDHGTAEDTFQATFLVLVCKARTIRGRESIGGWLHRVAYRIALNASAEAARQRDRERLVGDSLITFQGRDDARNDLHRILHEEVARLSEKYRLPVLLCDLEGKTHAQAASDLKWGEATVRRRRTRAHDLLRSRLARRGFGLTVAGLAATLGESPAVNLSTTCISATVRAASQISTTAMRVAIGEVVSTTAAALVRNSLRAMLVGELKALGSVVLVFCVLGGIALGLALPRHDLVGVGGAMPGKDDVPAALSPQPKTARPADSRETFTYEGRVLDPEGRPFHGAALYLNSYRLKQPGVLPVRATSGVDGRFRFTVSRSDFDSTNGEDPWSPSTIVASARGFAFGIATARGDTRELTLQLVRDDMPITARIIDLEGRPVAKVTVKVLNVKSTPRESLDEWLKAIAERKEYNKVEREFLPVALEGPAVPSLIHPVVTGADGTCRIDGVGRERVTSLLVEGPTIESKQFEVRTRAGETIRVADDKSTMAGENLVTIYGARFEHVAGPTRPIEGVVRDQDTGKPLAGIMVRGEASVAGDPIVYVQSITDAQGRYRLVGLPRGREGEIVAVPPCDFHVLEPLKASMNVPRDEELPYLPTGVTVARTHEVGLVHLDIKMKRGVWVTGRVIDPSTGKPVRGYVDYFVYLDNSDLGSVPSLHLNTYHFIRNDGTFGCVALSGRGVLAARAIGDDYVFGAGIEKFTRKPENGFLNTLPYHAIPTNYHVLAEINPTEGAATLTRDLVLETGRSLMVSALGPDGKPLTDMKIAGLKDMGYWETPPANASTHTIISLKPGKGRSLTFLNEKKGLVGQLILRGDETEPQKVILQPWGVITGRVVHRNGEPWSECEVGGVNLPGDRSLVDKDGRFRIEGLIPGKSYTLELRSKRSQPEGTIARDLKIRAGETIDLHEVVPRDQIPIATRCVVQDKRRERNAFVGLTLRQV